MLFQKAKVSGSLCSTFRLANDCYLSVASVTSIQLVCFITTYFSVVAENERKGELK